MIPKTIHYCWFGRNPKPELAKKCIRSWKKHCPDYEIIEWNEDNFDISSSPLYVRQAYEAKKWAFVTDYVRLWALTELGGIYMDTDVEVKKPLDKFLHHQAFSGFEDETCIPTGIMACEKGFPLFQKLLDYYSTASFYNPDGTPNLTTNVATITNLCLERGFVPNNTFQVVEGFALYPKDVFCPVSYQTGKLKNTRNTATIHWFSGSWQTAEQKARISAYRKSQKKLQRKAVLHNIKCLPNRIIKGVLGDIRYEQLKKKLKRGK